MNNTNNLNAVVEDATKTWTKEDHISFLDARVKARMQRMEELSESIKKMQSFNQRDLLRIEELRLLRDIRDGKVRLVHGKTGQPFSVRVFDFVHGETGQPLTARVYSPEDLDA